MLIRFGRPEERRALEELQRRASLVWDDYRDALLANPDAIDLPIDQITAERVRVAEVNGAVAGFSVLLPATSDTFELDGLFVEPALWGSGIGRALVGDAIERARQEGARTIDVIAGPRAETFYAKCGFVPAGEAQTRFGPALRIRRTFT